MLNTSFPTGSGRVPDKASCVASVTRRLTFPSNDQREVQSGHLAVFLALI
jgi:hypothetical protein